MTGGVSARIAELCSLYHVVGDGAEARFAALLERLEADDRAPTTIRERERAVDVHLADSLSALALEQLSAPATIVDIGSGAGFPGLPLAIARPAARVVLLESIGRKCVFLEATVDAIDVDNVDVVCERAELWEAGIGANDLATARAVGSPAIVLEYAAPLLKLGGALVDWRGRRDVDAQRSARVAAAQLGLEQADSVRVEPYEGAQHHTLDLYVKVRDTPDRFPRRAGIARKRPLG